MHTKILKTIDRAILLDIAKEDLPSIFTEFKDKELVDIIADEKLDLDYVKTDMLINVIIRRD